MLTLSLKKKFELLNIDISSLSDEVFYCSNSHLIKANIEQYAEYVQQRRLVRKPVIVVIYNFANYSEDDYSLKNNLTYSVTINYGIAFELPTIVSPKSYRKLLKDIRDYNQKIIIADYTETATCIICTGITLSDSFFVVNAFLELQNEPSTETAIEHKCVNCIYHVFLDDIDSHLCTAGNALSKDICKLTECYDWKYLNPYIDRFEYSLLLSRVRTDIILD